MNPRGVQKNSKALRCGPLDHARKRLHGRFRSAIGRQRHVGSGRYLATSIPYQLGSRSAYLVPAMGAVLLSGPTIAAGEGCAVRFQPSLNLEAAAASELVLIDAGNGR